MTRRVNDTLDFARQVLTWALLLGISFPLFWLASTALRPETELFSRPPSLLPKTYTIDNFSRLLFETPFLIYFRNSAIVATSTTIFVVTIAVFAAYSLSRFRTRFGWIVERTILITYLLPSVVIFLPIYLMLSRLGLVNTHFGLVIAYTTFALPFAIWLLRSFVDSIPVELELSAMVDGASRIGAFIDIVVPQLLPGIVSTALFTAILAWNEYLYALILTNSDAVKTLPPGVMTLLTSSYNIEWGMLMAASVLISMPVIIAFAFLQKHLTRGFGAGAVKG
jgi:multiple sugar transport system permease protein